MNKRKARSDSKSRATARKHPLARHPHGVPTPGETPDRRARGAPAAADREDADAANARGEAEE